MNAIPQTIVALRQPKIVTRLDLTFADLITLIETSDTLSRDEKRIWPSDLRTAAAMLGLSPATVPCDVIRLNETVFRKDCTDFGKSYDRFRNIKLSLRKALALVGLHQPRICGEAGLSPAWIRVLDAALVVPQRAGLRRMARFCAIRFIEPDQLTNPVFADFLEEQGHPELPAILRQAHGAGAWRVGGEWFAGFELPGGDPDPRACPAFLDVVRRLAEFARQHHPCVAVVEGGVRPSSCCILPTVAIPRTVELADHP